jgi:hypothetical protein
MKIYLKDKMVAKPVVFYIRNVPLLALPFWIFPIKPAATPGFLFPQFELGINNPPASSCRNAATTTRRTTTWTSRSRRLLPVRAIVGDTQ